MSLRAVLLAAGFATRLYPLTRDRPKPLLEVGGVPLLTRLLRQIEATGDVSDVTVVTNGRFEAEFATWHATLETSLPVRLVSDGVRDERCNLGAIADLALALRSMGAADDALPDGYLVAAGDNLLDEPLDRFTGHYLARRRPLLLVRDIPAPIPPATYNEVELDDDGRVLAMREKPLHPSTPKASIGVYLLPAELPALVDRYLAEGGAPDAPGHLMVWLVRRGEVEALPLTGRWFDIGNAEQFAQARAAFGGTADGPAGNTDDTADD